MIALARTKFNDHYEWLVARIVVEQQNGKVLGIEALDVTHAISGKFTSIKETENWASQGPHSEKMTDNAHQFSVNISIAELLKIVNRTYQSLLSDDVIEKLGVERTSEKEGLFSDRTSESISNRSLLANAFESMAQNDIEKQKIAEYKAKIETKNAEERKLRDLKEQIKEMSFAKGPRDTAKLRSLREEAIKTANRLSIYDGQLLRLEASKPLQNVLLREKKKAYDRAKQKGKEALDAYRKAEIERSLKWKNEVKEKYQASKKKAIETREKREAREKLQKLVIETAKWISYHKCCVCRLR